MDWSRRIRTLDNFSALRAALLIGVSVCGSACTGRGAGAHPALDTARSAPSASDVASAGAVDGACGAAIERTLSQPGLPGAPDFDRSRAHVLGRVRGEPMVFVREPSQPDADALPAAQQASLRLLQRGPPGQRVIQVMARHGADRAALRTLLLREGYVYSADPHDALALITRVRIADLFDDPEVWLSRAADVVRLQRVKVQGGVEYRYTSGQGAGHPVDLLFGDRLALSAEQLQSPLHRDLLSLAHEVGFSRARIVHRTSEALVAQLQFGDRWTPSLLESQGASVKLVCMDATVEAARELDAWRTAHRQRMQALGRIQSAIDAEVQEGLRFDRPEGEKTAELDGRLRPLWVDA
jgi:hypothetical protein